MHVLLSLHGLSHSMPVTKLNLMIKNQEAISKLTDTKRLFSPINEEPWYRSDTPK